MQEIWKDIEGFEGFYQVSNMGRVRSLDHIVDRVDGTTAFYRGRVLAPSGSAYLTVRLSKGSIRKSLRVHRLVADAFLEKSNDATDVDHIDFDKHNNKASNLRWVTHKQNMRYAWDDGRMNCRKPYSELDYETRERMVAKLRRPVVRDDGETFQSITAAAKALGVDRTAVSHVLCGLVETCKGHTFRYATSESSPSGLFS